MAQTFGTFKSIADRRDREAIDKTIAAAANLPAATHQERVNAEMFKAIEILGRKLDRFDDDRDRLTRRLALIESSATVDEKTGRLYLPVLSDAGVEYTSAVVPKWMLGVTLVSCMLAVMALTLVTLRPAPTVLTAEQLAILNELSTTRMGALNSPIAPIATTEDEPPTWQPVETVTDEVTAVDSSVDSFITQTMPSEEVAAGEQLTSPTLSDTAADSGPIAEAPAMPPAPAAETAAEAKPAAPVEETAAAVPAPETTVTEETAAPATPEPPVQIAAATPEKVVTPEVKETVSSKARGAAGPPPLIAGLDIGRDHNLNDAAMEVETRAMEGVPAAQHDLATMYAAGKGAQQDYKRAVYWFAQAAEGGIANAHYNLGVMFQQGLGVRKDAGRALSWYEKAAELGHPEAMYNLGIAYIEGVGATRDINRGIDYFEQAADAGVAQAAFNLGVLYESGFAGPIDLATARGWYEKAGTSGHTDALTALARLEKQLGQQTPASLTAADMVEPAAGDAVYQNDLVGKIQRALIDRGYLPAPANGIFDERTEDAIRAWQNDNGVSDDGVPSLTLLGSITKQPKKK